MDEKKKQQTASGGPEKKMGFDFPEMPAADKSTVQKMPQMKMM